MRVSAPFKPVDGFAAVHLETRPGSYLLLLASTSRRRVPIGKHGVLELVPGIYAYSGSALGPGGLSRRLWRHILGSENRHWHIDHLRAKTRATGVIYTYDTQRLECRWARGLIAATGARVPSAGFGSSDCRCPSHLLYFMDMPELDSLRGIMRTHGGCDSLLHCALRLDHTWRDIGHPA